MAHFISKTSKMDQLEQREEGELWRQNKIDEHEQTIRDLHVREQDMEE